MRGRYVRGGSLLVNPLVRKEDTMGLYERLLQEAAQEAEENPEREEQRRRPARKCQRMQAYVNSRRRAVLDEGGYVTSEEVQRDQERQLADLQVLRGLVSGGVRSFGAGYRLARLRRKYPVEYAHLRDIEISSG
jgi:hypothetical protein